LDLKICTLGKDSFADLAHLSVRNGKISPVIALVLPFPNRGLPFFEDLKIARDIYVKSAD